MDILKRSVSPITDQAWNEIDEQAGKVLRNRLSARRFVDVSGPYGWDHAVVPTGRLEVSPAGAQEEVRWGVHIVQPLVEARICFQLDMWELDNIIRGARDLRLEPLIEAANRIAEFEENAIYHGFDPGNITGLAQAGSENALDISTGSPADIMSGLSEAVMAMGRNSIEGPFALVAGTRLWQALDILGEGYPLRKRVNALFEGGTIFCPEVEGGFAVSTRGGDFELTLGQDVSIGYETTIAGSVRLFMAESFTFRVIEPNAVVPLGI